MMTIGVLFIALDAVTVGFLQIIVYVGAIMVLFLFVIWLLNLQSEPVPVGHLGLKLFAAVAVSAMVAELFVFVKKINPSLHEMPILVGCGSIDMLADTLFGKYLMAFEVTSILLLVAVIGAVAVARRGLPDRPDRIVPAPGTPPKQGAAS